MCDECDEDGPPKGGFWQNEIAIKQAIVLACGPVCNECNGESPPKGGFWGNAAAIKTNNFVG